MQTVQFFLLFLAAMTTAACGSSKTGQTQSPINTVSPPYMPPSAGPPASLAVSGAGDVAVNTPFPLIARYLDSANNLIDDTNVIATISIASDANLTGIVSRHLSGGQALFTSLRISNPGSYIIHVTAGDFNADVPPFTARTPTWGVDPRNIDMQIQDQSADSNTVLAVDSATVNFISHDRGQSWQALVLSPSERTFGPGHLDVTDSDVLYFPEHVSRDGGNTFTVTSFSYLKQDTQGVLYAAQAPVGRPLIRSTDHGQTFTTIDALSDRYPAEVYVDPNSGAILVCFYNGGDCASSHDGGATWTEGATIGQYNAVTGLYADPSTNNVVYAKTTNPPSVWQSADFGGTWTRIQPPVLAQENGADTLALYVTPGPAARLYVLTREADGNNPYNPSSVVVSGDNGATWKPVGFGLPSGCVSLAADRSDPNTLYADCPVDGGFKLFVTHTAGQ